MKQATFPVANLKKATLSCKIALISPGEPFHVKETENDWIINRYVLREKGRTLFGPAPKTLVDPIAKEDLMQAFQGLMKEWRELDKAYRGYESTELSSIRDLNDV